MQNKKYANFFQNNLYYVQRSDSNIIKQKKQCYVQKNNNLIKNNDRYNTSSKINNQNNNFNRYNSNKNKVIFDIRVFYCLKMLGLDYLYNIFEKNNISFDELLVLSRKDLINLGIQKSEQLIIKKFTLDYIKKVVIIL